jgi:hypothetical protein
MLPLLTRRTLLMAALPLVLPALRTEAAAPEGWTRVVSDGFTARNNVYVPWTVEFRNQLYAATVANAASAVFSKSNKLGGDIWRSADGAGWQQVGVAGLGNPQSASFHLVVFKDRLYALSNTINAGGAEVWVSDDGAAFAPLMKGGFGDAANSWTQGFVFAGRLIVAVAGADGGPHFEVSGDGAAFQAAASPGLGGGGNLGISLMGTPPVFKGQVYAGTSNPSAGGEIWRSADGLAWERVAEKGLSRRGNTSLTPMVEFAGQLYAVGITAGSLERLAGVEVYRTADGRQWDRVVEDGFGQGPERNVTGALTVFGGRLYLVTNAMDPRLLIPGHPGERHAPLGFQLWVSDDGASWQKAGEDGFGRSTALWAAIDVIGGTAFLTAFDYRQGTRLWQSPDGGQWQLIFQAPEPSPFGEGGGVVGFAGHLLWFDNDLARGCAIWRQDAPLAP